MNLNYKALEGAKSNRLRKRLDEIIGPCVEYWLCVDNCKFLDRLGQTPKELADNFKALTEVAKGNR